MEFIIGVFIVIILFISYGVFSRKRIYDEVDRLDAWKIEIMNRPINEELSKMKQLKMSGQTEEKFEEWRQVWDEIVTAKLPRVEEQLYDAEEAADRYRFKKAKMITLEIRTVLQQADASIEELVVELNELITSDEQNKTDIDYLKTIFRENKKLLLAHQRSFGKAAALFEKQLQEASRMFSDYDGKTEQGDLIEASEVVTSLKDLLTSMKDKMDVIPELLEQCTVHLPQRLNELTNGFREMAEKGFFLGDYGFEQDVENMLETCEHYLLSLEKAEVEDVKTGIDEMAARIEVIYDQLEEEVKCRKTVETQLPEVKPLLDEMAEQLVHTKEETEVVKRSYELNDKNLAAQADLELRLGLLQKTYEQALDKVNKQKISYFKLNLDLKKLKDDISKLNTSHQEFKEMLETLRKDELAAKEAIKRMKKQILEVKRLIQRSTLPGVPDHYIREFEFADDALIEVSRKLDEKPLNMTAVNNLLKEAEDAVTKLYNHTLDMLEQADLAEKIIQYGNRYRSSNHRIAEKLNEAERLFRHFDYETALETAASAVEEADPGALKRMEYHAEARD